MVSNCLTDTEVILLENDFRKFASKLSSNIFQNAQSIKAIADNINLQILG